MSRIEDEKNELSENINNLNSLLSQKENTINKLNDFINNFKQDFESVKNEKDLAISKVVQLERDFTLLRRNINLKEGEIDKLNNINTIYERENEILKMRLGK
jgi:chromosome segregation ATPase